jgi:lactam utilization protein B
VAKHKITREAAEAHDAEVREHVKRQQAAWEEKYTLMLALGHALPEGRLTPTARKQLHKRADKIVRSALIKILNGEELDFEMRTLARHCWNSKSVAVVVRSRGVSKNI